MEASRHSLFQPVAFRQGVLSDPPNASGANAVRPACASPAPPLPPLPQSFLSTSSLAQPSGVASPTPSRSFPTLPYYAPARGLQLRVQLRDGRGVAALQSLLHRTASRHGVLYAFGSALKKPATATTANADAATTSAAPVLDRVGYVTALLDGFARISALRDRCRRHSPPRATHHVLYVLISGDVQLKDLSVLLAVENGRLCLCICASSRATQEYLSQRALAVGLPLIWVYGAALIAEPQSMDAAALSPVAAAWDTIVNLNLHATADVAVFASFPLAGATWHAPTLRFVETYSSPGVGREAEGDAGPFSVSALRALWTLAGPSPRLVLPQFIAAIVRVLVERSGVEAFELRLLYDEADAMTGDGAAVSDGISETAAARGIVFVGAARDGAVVRTGPTSAASPLAFSRLSAAVWLSDEDRRRSGLVPADAAEEEPLECEFALDALRYARETGGEGFGENKGGAGDAGEEAREEDLLETRRWGECFQVRLHVERIIDGDGTE